VAATCRVCHSSSGTSAASSCTLATGVTTMVIAARPSLSPLAATMVAVPTCRASTTPCALTVATARTWAVGSSLPPPAVIATSAAATSTRSGKIDRWNVMGAAGPFVPAEPTGHRLALRRRGQAAAE
jgi:hypothetical protein